MSNNFVNGRDIVIAIDPAAGTSYKLVVCLTSNTMTGQLSQLDATSKCGNQWVAGQKFEQTITGEGFLIDPDTGSPTNQGFPELFKLYTDRTQFTAKFGKASPTSGEATYSGPAFITNLEETAADDALVKFTFTMRSATPPFTQTIVY